MSITPGTRGDWRQLAKGGRVVPVVLVAGVPVAFVPEGMVVTACDLAGTVDSAWWPGASADLTAIARPWLSLAHGVQWSERARPTDAQALDVGSVEILLSDVGGEATALLAQRDAITGTPITSEVGPADTTVHVVDTGVFPSSGVFHLGRECIGYSGVTSTSFTGCTRGLYGSFAYRHLYSSLSGGGVNTELPLASDGPADLIARVATLWMCTVSAAGEITAAELEYFGHVQTDVQLADDGDGWIVRIDHAVHKVGAPLREVAVTIGGYSHVGNQGVRGHNPTRDTGSSTSPPIGTCPLAVVISPDTSSVLYEVSLSDAAADPDAGGWHADRSSFISAFQRAADSIMSGGDHVTVGLDASQRLRVDWVGGSEQNIDILAPWLADGTVGSSGAAAFNHRAFTPGAMPLAWVPINVDSRVYLTPGDYASVPAVPSNPVSGVPGRCELHYVLALGMGALTRYAKVTANTSGAGVYYLTCTALDGADVPITPPPPGTPASPGAGFATAAFCLTAPTPARLALWIECDNWVDGVQALLAALDTDAGDGLSAAFDFDDMRRVLARYAPAFPTFRFFAFDLASTPLAWLLNECAINGFALTLRRGRISLVRVAEFALTEALDGTIESIDLTVAGPVPGYTRGSEPIVNRFTFRWPASKYEVNVYDANSLALYGHQKVGIEADVPVGVVANDVTPSALYTAITALGVTTLGPHRKPAETVSTSLSLAAFGLQLGDLIDVTLWRVPNQARTRGVRHAVGQVIGRELVAYGESQEGAVRLAIRLSPAGLAGWAPSIVVAAGGIVGAVVTAEASPFGGSSGTAPSGLPPTYGFVVGDKVRVVEIDSTSPTTATRHTVTAVGPSALTLNPAPSATFAGLAASTYKVVVLPDDFDTAGLQEGQKRYAYLAPRATLLLAVGAPAQKYAA